MKSENTNPEKIINQARHQCHQTRSRYWAERVADTEISQQTHLALAQRVLRYYDALHEYRDDVDGMPDVDELMSKTGRTTEIVTKSGRRGWDNKLTTKEVPAVLDIPPERLVEISKQLDDAAHELDLTDESGV